MVFKDVFGKEKRRQEKELEAKLLQLEEQLADPNIDKRIKALVSAHAIGRDAISVVSAAADNDAWPVRGAAIYLLTQILPADDEVLRRILSRSLHDSSATVRNIAAPLLEASLVGRENTEIADRLEMLNYSLGINAEHIAEPLLNGMDRALEIYVEDILGNPSRRPGVTSIEEAILESGEHSLHVLPRLKEVVEEFSHRGIMSKEGSREAAKLLGRLGEPGLRVLADCLEHEDKMVGQCAIHGLEIAGAAGENILLQALKTADPEMSIVIKNTLSFMDFQKNAASEDSAKKTK